MGLLNVFDVIFRVCSQVQDFRLLVVFCYIYLPFHKFSCLCETAPLEQVQMNCKENKPVGHLRMCVNQKCESSLVFVTCGNQISTCAMFSLDAIMILPGQVWPAMSQTSSQSSTAEAGILWKGECPLPKWKRPSQFDAWQRITLALGTES